MNKYLRFLLLFLLISGCYKDSDVVVVEKEIVIQMTKVFVDTKISGYVLDNEGNRISDYSLIINEETFNISSEYFLISLKNAKQKGQVIYIEKDGEIIGLATVLLVENDINRFNLNTFSKKKRSGFESGKTIELDDVQIDISDTEFQNEVGQNSVDFIKIEATKNVTNIGFSALGEVFVIDPMGGFFIELLNENGDILNIEDNSNFKLNFDGLNASINSLFYFNPHHENWEKVSDIDINHLGVKVNKTGYYLFGKTQTGVFYKGSISKDKLAVAYLSLDWSGNKMNVEYNSTLKGNWITILPENQAIELSLKKTCDEAIKMSSFTTTDVDMSTENYDIKEEIGILLETKVIDCSGELLENASIDFNNQEIYSFHNSNLKIWLPDNCTEKIHLSVVNLNNDLYGFKQLWNTDTKVLFGCDQVPNQYSYFNIGDEIKISNSFEYGIENGQTIFTGTNGNIKINIFGIDEGTYEESEVYISINDETFGSRGFYIDCEGTGIGCGIDQCNITQKNMGNGWVTLKLSGTLWMQTIDPPVAGNFKIECEITAKKS